MQDRRSELRTLTLKTGKIVSEQHRLEIETAVLDISDGGACLLVSDATRVPETFRLRLDYKPEVHDCEVRWRSGHKLGIRFQ